MSVEFSAKISMLRKEKGITQRQAAQDLKISQALLSHYEKGIRECNLDFVKKAAEYYGVTADFLLGITESKRSLSDLYSADATESDADFTPKSVIRSLIWLSEKTASGDEAGSFYTDYFSLCIKKYMETLRGASGKIRLCDLSIQTLTETRRTSRAKSSAVNTLPKAVETVLEHADRLTSETLSSITE